jgi:hypothetical protein
MCRAPVRHNCSQALISGLCAGLDDSYLDGAKNLVWARLLDLSARWLAHSREILDRLERGLERCEKLPGTEEFIARKTHAQAKAHLHLAEFYDSMFSHDLQSEEYRMHIQTQRKVMKASAQNKKFKSSAQFLSSLEKEQDNLSSRRRDNLEKALEQYMSSIKHSSDAKRNQAIVFRILHLWFENCEDKDTETASRETDTASKETDTASKTRKLHFPCLNKLMLGYITDLDTVRPFLFVARQLISRLDDVKHSSEDKRDFQVTPEAGPVTWSSKTGEGWMIAFLHNFTCHCTNRSAPCRRRL